MGSDCDMRPRRKAPGSSERAPWLRALGRRLRASQDGSSDARSDEAEEAELEGTSSVEEGLSLSGFIECPEPGCGAAASVADFGVSMPGVGYCGHEYVFKMVKIFCTEGHRLDALDEANCVHSPEECEHR